MAYMRHVIAKFLKTRCLSIAVVLLLVTFLAVFIYGIAGILVPARQIQNGQDHECDIVRAKLHCWRRAPLKFSEIERGHYSCWLFHVRISFGGGNSTEPGSVLFNMTEPIGGNSSLTKQSAPGNSSKPLNSSAEANPRVLPSSNETVKSINQSNTYLYPAKTFISQYGPVHVFPTTRDSCNSFDACGNTTWSCKIVPSHEGLVRMRWRFPTKAFIQSMLLAKLLLVLAITAGYTIWRERLKSKIKGENDEERADVDIDDSNKRSGVVGQESPWVSDSGTGDELSANRSFAFGERTTMFAPQMTTEEILDVVDLSGTDDRTREV